MGGLPVRECELNESDPVAQGVPGHCALMAFPKPR